MNSKLLKGIEYLFYLMILFYLVGKTFEIFTILIDILFIVFLFKNKNIAISFYKEYKNLINAFGALLGYFFIQSLFTNEIVVSLKHSVGMLRFIILLFAVIYVFDSKEKIKNLMIVLSIIVSFVSIDAIFQYFNGVDLFNKPLSSFNRLTGWNNKPIVSLYTMELIGFILASLFLFIKNKRIFLLLVISLLLMLFMMFLSGNRTSILSLFSAIIIISLFSKYKKYFIILLSLFFIVFGLSFFNEKLASRYSAIISPNIENTSGRLQIYYTSFEMIKEKPLFGFGAGTFRYEFNNYFDKISDLTKINKYNNIYIKNPPYHSHNATLDIIISWGITGLILLSYIGLIIYKKYIKGNEHTLIASIGTIYCLSPFQFAKSFSQSNWQFYTFLSLTLVIIIYNYEKMNNNLKMEKNE